MKKIQVKKKISKLWSHYRADKKFVLKSKRFTPFEKKAIITENLEITRNNISIAWDEYRGLKYGLVRKSPYEGFKLYKKTVTTNTEQFWYKLNKGYNKNKLDDQVGEILDEPGVTGVLLIFLVKEEETEKLIYASDYITKTLYDRLIFNAEEYVDVLWSHLTDKLTYSNSVGEFELKGMYIRIIYEKSKKRKGEAA